MLLAAPSSVAFADVLSEALGAGGASAKKESVVVLFFCAFESSFLTRWGAPSGSQKVADYVELESVLVCAFF